METVGSGMGLRVRLAAPDDTDVVAELLFAFNTEFASPTPSPMQFAPRLRLMLEGPVAFVVLAEIDHIGVGFALVTTRPTPYGDGPLAQLEELYVRPDLRNHGIGTNIMTAVVDEVWRRDGIEIHINVDEIDRDTRRFYERHGFTNIQPGADFAMLCYLRELGSPESA